MHTNYHGERVTSTRYERELQHLKPYDEVQSTERASVGGLDFIVTAGHGYLVVPTTHARANEARALCVYGFIGKHAIYLEEDCEARDFIEAGV